MDLTPTRQCNIVKYRERHRVIVLHEPYSSNIIIYTISDFGTGNKGGNKILEEKGKEKEVETNL